MELIVCASNIEFRIVNNLIKNKKYINENIFLSDSKMFAKIGVGIENSYKSLRNIIKQYDITAVILIGTCASTTNDLKLYDVLEPSIVSLYDLSNKAVIKDTIILNNNSTLHISSSNNCVQNAFESNMLKMHDVSLVDMESYSVAKICSKNNIPLTIIKGICDEPYNNNKDEYDDSDWAKFKNNTILVMQIICEQYLFKKKINK